MKVLKCEVCNSTSLLKDGDVFICQDCGAQYSLDIVKKMVQDKSSAEKVKKSNSESNDGKIENYLTLAKGEREGGNLYNAEAYCNKVLELDPCNYKAYIIKGHVVCGSSSLEDDKLDVAMNLYKKGLQYAPKNEKKACQDEIKVEFKKYFDFLITHIPTNFTNDPSIDSVIQMVSLLKLKAECDVLCDQPSSVEKDEYVAWMGMVGAAKIAYDAARHRYQYNAFSYVNVYIQIAESCINVVKAAIVRMQNHKKDVVDFYKILIKWTDQIRKASNVKSYKHAQIEKIGQYQAELAKIDPTYKAPPKILKKRNWLIVLSDVIAILAAVAIFTLGCIMITVEDKNFVPFVVGTSLYVVGWIINNVFCVAHTKYRGDDITLLIVYGIVAFIFFALVSNTPGIVGGLCALVNIGLVSLHATWLYK